MKLPGFGPETADVVALMVYDRPGFIFDVSARLLRQSGHDVGRGYEASRRAHEAAVVASRLDVGQPKNFHGLIITAGQRARAAGGWAVYGPTIGVGSMNR